jgi:hypothetical protein
MGMKVQKSKIFASVVKMHDYLFDCVDWGVSFGRWVYVAPVEIDAIGINSVVPPSHSVRVENRKDVENESVPKQSSLFASLSKFGYDACHNMGTWNFSRMNSGPNDDALLFWTKLSRLIFVGEQMFFLKLLDLVCDPFFGGNSQEVNGSSLKRVDDVGSLKVDVFLLFAFQLDLFQELVVVCVGPGVKEGNEDLLVGGHGVFESPFNPPFVIFLL